MHNNNLPKDERMLEESQEESLEEQLNSDEFSAVEEKAAKEPWANNLINEDQ